MDTNIEDLIIKNKLLEDEISNLYKQNRQLKMNIQNIQDLMAYEICEYFRNSYNLRETTKHFYFDDVRDCYGALVEYFGCSDTVQRATDYKECYKEIFDRDYEEEIEEDNVTEEIDSVS